MWAIRAGSRRAHHIARPNTAIASSFLRIAATADVHTDAKLVKRKVALVAGYLGTGYHGVQLNKNVPTIENELRRAILDVGAMRESNFADITKIDWARSSRTDKGVHAGCIVFSAKLLIDDNTAVDAATGRIASLTDSLNRVLPPTIRIFSSTRINKRFNARKNCVLREYEYFMPLSFLKDSFLASTTAGDDAEWDDMQAVDEFCRALRRYEGIHDFHNFTRSRSFFYKEHAKKKQRYTTQNDDSDSDKDDNDDSDDDEEEEEADDGTYTTAEYADVESQYVDKQATFRKSLPRHRRSIYSCSGSLVHDFFGEPYLRVHIVGQAFLLHQIRCMVGGAIAVATRGMSRVQFDAAIDTSRIVRVPIAPAEGLVLLSSTFGGKLHSVSLYQDQNTPLAKETRGVAHRILLNAQEDKTMQEFRENVIYREVTRAWKDLEGIDRWRAYLERSFESNQSLDENELLALLNEATQQQQEQKKRRSTFVRQNRNGETEDKTARGVLPRQFTTKLCVRYSIAPGIFTSDVQRGIARHLRLGNIAVDADEEQLFDFVDEYTVQKLAEEGRNLRLKRFADGKPRQPRQGGNKNRTDTSE